MRRRDKRSLMMVIKLNMMTDAGNYVSTAYSAVLTLVVVAVVVVAGEMISGQLGRC